MSRLAEWIETALGAVPSDVTLYERALTHGSTGSPDYQRLEFLGDRVLGLVIAEWLYELYPDDKEGRLSARLNALVNGATCAQVARALCVAQHLRLGKQARDDGASDSDNVLGDVTEALIGVLLLDQGMEVARSFIRERWAELVAGVTN
ncbi:MAG: ribonuclease III, partial [Alphaproteobacteria bacterium]|nr:ribonuclease III [Alphaproteobacteria bacterium]